MYMYRSQICVDAIEYSPFPQENNFRADIDQLLCDEKPNLPEIK